MSDTIDVRDHIFAGVQESVRGDEMGFGEGEGVKKSSWSGEQALGVDSRFRGVGAICEEHAKLHPSPQHPWEILQRATAEVKTLSYKIKVTGGLRDRLRADQKTYPLKPMTGSAHRFAHKTPSSHNQNVIQVDKKQHKQPPDRGLDHTVQQILTQEGQILPTEWQGLPRILCITHVHTELTNPRRWQAQTPKTAGQVHFGQFLPPPAPPTKWSHKGAPSGAVENLSAYSHHRRCGWRNSR